MASVASSNHRDGGRGRHRDDERVVGPGGSRSVTGNPFDDEIHGEAGIDV